VRGRLVSAEGGLGLGATRSMGARGVGDEPHLRDSSSMLEGKLDALGRSCGGR
jgi:hypothetical protein